MLYRFVLTVAVMFCISTVPAAAAPGTPGGLSPTSWVTVGSPASLSWQPVANANTYQIVAEYWQNGNWVYDNTYSTSTSSFMYLPKVQNTYIAWTVRAGQSSWWSTSWGSFSSWAFFFAQPTQPAVSGVSQTSSQVDLSTGDKNKNILVNVTPNTISFSPTFSSQKMANPNSSCDVQLSFPAASGTGSVADAVTAAPAGCSGVFSVTAAVKQVKSKNSTTVVVPPQILLQMLYGEAHGQAAIGDNVSQLAIGVATRNRFSQPGFFSKVTTYQAAVTPGQFDGISSITTGPSPDIDNAVAVYTSTDHVSVANAACFFSPTAAGWISIQAALKSKTLSLPTVSLDPKCYGANRQFVVKQSVGNNADRRGAPAFIFEQQRNPKTDPAVIQIP